MEVSNQSTVAILPGISTEDIPDAWLNEYDRWYFKTSLLSYPEEGQTDRAKIAPPG